MKNLTQNPKTYGLASVLGGFIIHLTLGNLYSFGNMMTYMDSYMHMRVDENITYTNFIWVNSVTTGSQGTFMFFAGVLEKKIGGRLTCFVGSCLLSSGIALTYFSIKTSFASVMFTYGFMSGLGISLSYVIPMACGMKWFPQSKGLVSGIIVGGFGLGSLGSTMLQTRFLNPDNISVSPTGYFDDDSILDRVPYVFLLLGGIFFCMQMISCLLISSPGEQAPPVKRIEMELLLSDDEGGGQDTVESEKRPRLKALSVKEAFFSREFRLLWCIYLFNTIGVGYITAMYKSFGQTFIKNDFFLSEVGSLSAVFNFGGRIFWGRLMDKTSFRLAMTMMSLCLSSMYVFLPLTASLGKAWFAVCVWGIFFSFSGTFVLVSTATEKAFGSTNYPSIYGLIFTNQIFSALILAFINEAILSSIGFTGSFLTVAGIVSGSALFTCFMPKHL